MNRICAAFALLLAGCGPAIKPASLQDLRYVPGQTTADELIQQAGLPDRVMTTEFEGVTYDEYIYAGGPESVTVFMPVLMPVPGAPASMSSSSYRPRSGAAMSCLVSKDRKVFRCAAGDAS